MWHIRCHLLEFWTIKEKDFPLGQHLIECCGSAHKIEWDILNACLGVEKLNTIEAIYMKKAETANKYAQRMPGKGIDIEKLDQNQQI